MAAPYTGESTDPHVSGLVGSNASTGIGVLGQSAQGAGVNGISQGGGDGTGVWGDCQNGRGVVGVSNAGAGVWGEAAQARGVVGVSRGDGAGVWGDCQNGRGVVGVSNAGTGVWGESASGVGVVGKGAHLAGRFEGDVEVTGDIRFTALQGDCAEEFDLAGPVRPEPGTVVVLGDDGAIAPSQQGYDRRVAGVVSGAGAYRPALVLDTRPSRGERLPIALLGKVYCLADAQYGPIGVGDLLTTSPTAGHAMKATDPLRAFGAVLGKALGPLVAGQELIPILVALQ
ncbi:MAG TPA: hypothetical protein VFU72_12670 [Nitrolancea sp.]|nr:hypothetical protein [Nitrolancea sp.]